jgi:NADH-quinone oxidoreductase subunit F
MQMNLNQERSRSLLDGIYSSFDRRNDHFSFGVQTYPIYIRGEYVWVYKILEKSIEEAKAAGWLGKNILGTGYDLELYVHIGAGATFVVKKPLLIESLEGKGNPRIKPPFPAVSGLCGN